MVSMLPIQLFEKQTRGLGLGLFVWSNVAKCVLSRHRASSQPVLSCCDASSAETAGIFAPTKFRTMLCSPVEPVRQKHVSEGAHDASAEHCRSPPCDSGSGAYTVLQFSTVLQISAAPSSFVSEQEHTGNISLSLEALARPTRRVQQAWVRAAGQPFCPHAPASLRACQFNLTVVPRCDAES